ncbi:hypothetical protein [Lactobacillus sp.]|uniref:hypothetical protein n=1 Tax=Lactobacillus sp. TaxID=1591 RepID=UPI003F09F6B1
MENGYEMSWDEIENASSYAFKNPEKPAFFLANEKNHNLSLRAIFSSVTITGEKKIIKKQ